MRLESKKYLYDIARAAGLALEFVRGKSFADYAADALLRSAVERQLEIVGEALDTATSCATTGCHARTTWNNSPRCCS